jgi:transposase-like protein
MIGVFLVNKYKKITKKIMDKNKNKMDYQVIGNYKYSALFEDQKYIFDDEAAMKLIFMGLKNISKKWTMPIRNWGGAAPNQFAIIYGEDRVPL